MTRRRAGAPGDLQMALDLPHCEALAGGDFLVAPCNRDAVRWIDRWPDWPGPLLAVWGPPGCGKTHLAAVFLARSGGVRITWDALRQPFPDIPDRAAAVLEDAEAALAAGSEAALLHLHNGIAERGGTLLLTALNPPARWPLALADLASRLRAAPAVAIGPPDDALIAALLVKLFADRQVKVTPPVVAYVAARIERSFATARAAVAALDAAALRAGRPVTLKLARAVLEAAEPAP